MPYCHSDNTDRKPSGSTNYNCSCTGKISKKKVTIATQTEKPENEWVLEQYTEQPMNELDNCHEMLMRICAVDWI